MVTNYEKFKSRIITLFSRGMTLAVIDGDPCCCRDNSGIIPDAICECCDLYGMGSCEEARLKWLYAEYVECPKLTKAEKSFCESLRPGYYLARDANGLLHVYDHQPKRDTYKWLMQGSYNYYKFDSAIFSGNFDFIKWEDSEPWSVEDLLKLEVIDDDN